MDEAAQLQAIESLRAGSADEAAIALGRLLAVTEAALERRAQLEHALQSRVAIEQAKGVLAERFRLTVDDGFLLLRRSARTERVKIHDLARDIVSRRETPTAVSRAMASNRRIRAAAMRDLPNLRTQPSR